MRLAVNGGERGSYLLNDRRHSKIYCIIYYYLKDEDSPERVKPAKKVKKGVFQRAILHPPQVDVESPEQGTDSEVPD